MSKGIQFLFKKNKIDHLAGHGTLKKGKKVEVKAEDGKVTTYNADHIILATGGRSRELPSMPIDGKKIIGYREIFVISQKGWIYTCWNPFFDLKDDQANKVTHIYLTDVFEVCSFIYKVDVFIIGLILRGQQAVLSRESGIQ